MTPASVQTQTRDERAEFTLDGVRGGRAVVLCNGQAGDRTATSHVANATMWLEQLDLTRTGPDPLASSLGDQLEAIRDSKFDVIVAIGGDGTINAAASLAVERDAPLVIVPAGTMNLLARDLMLDRGLSIVERSIPGLATRRIDYATANERPFLHSALFGLVPKLVESRERLRDPADAAEGLDAAFTWARDSYMSPPSRLTLQADSGRDTRVTRSLAITNNPLAGDGPFSYRREPLDGGVLGVYASTHRGVLAPLRMLTSLVTGSLRADPETLYASCTELSVGASVDRIKASLDGDVAELTTPVRFRSHHRGLKVVVPASTVDNPASTGGVS